MKAVLEKIYAQCGQFLITMFIYCGNYSVQKHGQNGSKKLQKREREGTEQYVDNNSAIAMLC